MWHGSLSWTSIWNAEVPMKGLKEQRDHTNVFPNTLCRSARVASIQKEWKRIMTRRRMSSWRKSGFQSPRKRKPNADTVGIVGKTGKWDRASQAKLREHSSSALGLSHSRGREKKCQAVNADTEMLAFVSPVLSLGVRALGDKAARLPTMFSTWF